MLLSPEQADLFIKLHSALIYFANQELQVVDNNRGPNRSSFLEMEERVAVLDAFAYDSGLIEEYVFANPFHLSNDELAVVASWRYAVTSEFVFYKKTKTQFLFIPAAQPELFFGVKGLTEDPSEFVGGRLPTLVQTSLLPFGDTIVFDGHLRATQISVDKRSMDYMNQAYQRAHRKGEVIETIKIPTHDRLYKLLNKKTKKRSKKDANKLNGCYEEIQKLVDEFCADHLNDEYTQLCRQLTEDLAQLPASPIVRGRATSWASGVVQTIGWVNFLDDPSQDPHLSFDVISRHFGVGKSTAQAKCKVIRDLFDIISLDPRWTLPSMAESNPLVWTASVNGLMIDLRHASREIQEQAFEQGIIPYIYADRIPSSPGEN